jgi:hypothetical protein
MHRFNVISAARVLRAASGWLATLALSAGSYSPPPSWDPMLMLDVRLDASNQLAVEPPGHVIRLTVAPGVYNASSNRYDLAVVSFDPAAPCAVLNGTAYSRVLGWNDPGTTGANGDDFYATYAAQLQGNFVWIEQTAGAPELRAYFINEDVTGDPGTPYTPIFGTNGSSPKWRWDGKMDHNAYAVALQHCRTANQLFTASYRLYVGDAAGTEVAGYGEATTTWRWQGPAVAVMPTLNVARTNAQVLLSWQPTVTGLRLETADALPATHWTAVPHVPVPRAGEDTVLLDPATNQQYFRLQLSP